MSVFSIGRHESDHGRREDASAGASARHGTRRVATAAAASLHAGRAAEMPREQRPGTERGKGAAGQVGERDRGERANTITVTSSEETGKEKRADFFFYTLHLP